MKVLKIALSYLIQLQALREVDWKILKIHYLLKRITVISPHETNENHHIDRVAEFWNELGSSTKILSSKDHDAIFAKTSHLPHVISYALMQSLFSKLHEKTFEFSGGSLEDYTRIASSDPDYVERHFHI